MSFEGEQEPFLCYFLFLFFDQQEEPKLSFIPIQQSQRKNQKELYILSTGFMTLVHGWYIIELYSSNHINWSQSFSFLVFFNKFIGLIPSYKWSVSRLGQIAHSFKSQTTDPHVYIPPSMSKMRMCRIKTLYICSYKLIITICKYNSCISILHFLCT